MNFLSRIGFVAAVVGIVALISLGHLLAWRHPIYASVIYFVWAGQVEAPAALPFLAAAVVTLGLLLRMLIEERFLAAEYPEYSGYAGRAKRFVPFIY